MSDPQNYKGIPQPVSNFVPTMRFGVRQARSVNYVKTDRRYLLELRFATDVELALFEKVIQNSPVRLIEYGIDSDRESRIFVTDDRIPDDEGQIPVFRWADEELPRIGAVIAMRFPHFVLPSCRCIIDLKGEDGRMNAILPGVRVKVVGRNNVPALQSVLNDPSDDLLQPFLNNCEDDPDFREAMMWCGLGTGFESAGSWASLYRAVEVVASRFSGIVNDLKYSSEAQLSRFKRTANHQKSIGTFSRHARMPCDPPPNPMTFDEAVEFVLGMVQMWQRSNK